MNMPDFTWLVGKIKQGLEKCCPKWSAALSEGPCLGLVPEKDVEIPFTSVLVSIVFRLILLAKLEGCQHFMWVPFLWGSMHAK